MKYGKNTARFAFLKALADIGKAIRALRQPVLSPEERLWHSADLRMRIGALQVRRRDNPELDQ